MAEKITGWLNQFPIWIPCAILAILSLGLGLMLARRVWGKNAARLKRAIDDSAYLASQWATLGISQSQLVERLDKRTHHERKEFWEKATAWQDALAERDRAISRLEKELDRMEEAKSSLTEREVEALQLQVSEIERRDSRIRTLEARLQHLDSQNEQNNEEHQKQTKVLLERISVLESNRSGTTDPEIEENNRQLTELLKQRCNELADLRDEFYAKEKDLVTLREQNAVLKKSVDDLVESWSDKKSQDGVATRLKTKLDASAEELNQLRKVYDQKVSELELLASESGSPEDRDKKLVAELAEAKAELEEQREEISRTSEQVDMLLSVIEARDSKVDELENQLNSKSSSKQNQVEALSQTIADLQSKANETESCFEKAKEEIDDLQAELDSVVRCHHHELEIRDRQISLLMENVESDILEGLDLDALRTQLEDIDPGEVGRANRILSETKNYGSRRRKDSPSQRGTKSVIYFGENSAYIKGESTDVISVIAQDVLDSGCQISVVGFSEKEGNEEFNETLSMRRAEAVREKFEEEGVEASLVIVKGKGEDTEFSESAESWKARRVEIVVLPVAEIIN